MRTQKTVRGWVLKLVGGVLKLDYLRLWSEEIEHGTDQVRLQLQAWF